VPLCRTVRGHRSWRELDAAHPPARDHPAPLAGRGAG